MVSDFVGDGAELTRLDFTEQIGLELSKEGKLTYENDVQDDTSSPHIGCLAGIRLLANQVRIHVVRSSTEDLQFLFLAILLRFDAETEVD